MTVKVTDTTMRDGHQSLLATRMRTGPTTLGLALPLAVCVTALACGSSDPSPSPSATNSSSPGCDPSPSPSAASSSSPGEYTCGTIDEVPFASQLLLPADLPKGLRLGTACWSESSRSQTTALYYGSEDGKGKLLITTDSGSRIPALKLDGLPTIRLGDLVGQVSDESQPGGGAFYFIQFEKDARLYSVAADVGVNNTVTREDIDAVALSIAVY